MRSCFGAGDAEVLLTLRDSDVERARVNVMEAAGRWAKVGANRAAWRNEESPADNIIGTAFQ